MSYIHAPIFKNLVKHTRLGCPFVAGISLTTVTPDGREWLSTHVGTKFDTLTADEATDRLVMIVAAARDEVAKDNERLVLAVARSGDDLKEAADLAKNPITGDEAAAIRGMAFTAEHAAAMPCETRDAAFLRGMLPRADGLDTAKISAAFDTLDAETANRAPLLTALLDAANRLAELAEQAGEPMSAERAAKLKVNAKLMRAAPAALVELRQLRQEATQITTHIDAVIARLEGAA